MTHQQQIELTLRRFFARQRDDVRRQLRQGRRPDLSAWTKPMVEVLLPIFQAIYAKTGKAKKREIAAKVETFLGKKPPKKLLKRLLAKNWGPWEPISEMAFDVFNPKVLDAIYQAVFAFCDATNQTATDTIAETLSNLGTTLGQALQGGETSRQISERVGQLFDDPQRAFTIAQTETSRAVHAGQILAAKETGIVAQKEWLASSDACDRCLSLNGKRVGLDQPYWVDPRGGPYAVVMHPPLHPNCFCVQTDIVDYDLVYAESRKIDPRRIVAALAGAGR